jgi:UDP-N-acetylmuramoylalanine--D-glutamate ligase
MTLANANATKADQGKALVLGMGATGVSIANFLAAQGRSADFADSRAEPPGAAAIRQALPEAQTHCGELPASVPGDVTEIFLSPGLGMQLPLLDDAKARGIPVRSDIDLFMSACQGKVLGITGSNGKSTVTTLVAQMLKAAGVPTAAGGNLGTPALDLLAADAEVYVLELSSFQLERSDFLPLHAAVVLNISPDHLDHHDSLEAYAAAKQRIYKKCGTAIINRDEFTPQPGQVSFGSDLPAATDWGVVENDDGQWIARGNLTVMPVSDLQVVGRHNLLNVLAAFALAATLDAPLDGLVAAARSFTGLPHRMQRVPSSDGITWIDDSKATNEAAALASIDAIAGPLILIAGGDAKGGDMRELAERLRNRQVSMVVIGKDRDLFVKRFADMLSVTIADSIEEAVNAAARLAAAGDTVLLAPACSSLDMFSGYTERGDRFAAAVKALQS